MDKNSSQALEEVSPNWPQPLSKTIDDLSRIARTEMKLLVAKLGLLLEAQTDKIAGVLFLIVALSYGSLFLLGGIVLLIHLWLAWWLSFLITGAAIVIAGVFFQMTMKAAARKRKPERHRRDVARSASASSNALGKMPPCRDLSGGQRQLRWS
jgi:Putative Actinobacterial Holin-X, holin superfamily III